MTQYSYYESPAGTLLLTAAGGTITGMHWVVFKRAPKPAPGWIEDVSVFKEATKQLDEYFTGVRHHFDLPVKVEVGTNFQKRVWQALHSIPFGETCTYGDIARAIGQPQAVRAVGHAVGSNPMSIVVPCHRVLASGNKINGYAGGLTAKALLLRLEGSSFKES